MGIYHLRTLKSTGQDGLSASFLRKVAVEIAVPLTHLFNLSLQQGIVLREWKQSYITPIHKGGPVGDLSNYRPISVVCVVAREKIVSTQLSSYLESHQLLHSDLLSW